MSVFIIGGTGFIGQRLVRLLVARGQTVTCMDINPGAHSSPISVRRLRPCAGMSLFDEVMAACRRRSRSAWSTSPTSSAATMPTCGDEAEPRHGQLLRGGALAGRNHHVCQLARRERQAGQLRQPPVTKKTG